MMMVSLVNDALVNLETLLTPPNFENLLTICKIPSLPLIHFDIILILIFIIFFFFNRRYPPPPLILSLLRSHESLVASSKKKHDCNKFVYKCCYVNIIIHSKNYLTTGSCNHFGKLMCQ